MRHDMLLVIVATITTSAITTVLVNALIFSADPARSAAEVATDPAGGDGQVQGDTDCDDDVDALDALGVLINVAAFDALVQQEPCVDIGDVIPAGEGPQGPPGPQGEAGPPGLSNVIVVNDQTESDSESPKNLGVDCPDGLRLIGGSQIISGHNLNVVAGGFPQGDPENTTRWAASAIEVTDGQADTWTLRAYAICAKVAE